MQNKQKGHRLHPMAWLAALSVTAFSAVGIGAITGLIPSADSHQEIRTESRMVAAEGRTTGAGTRCLPVLRGRRIGDDGTVER